MSALSPSPGVPFEGGLKLRHGAWIRWQKLSSPSGTPPECMQNQIRGLGAERRWYQQDALLSLISQLTWVHSQLLTILNHSCVGCVSQVNALACMQADTFEMPVMIIRINPC
eukprot:3933446-Rhodomonas_salina.4